LVVCLTTLSAATNTNGKGKSNGSSEAPLLEQPDLSACSACPNTEYLYFALAEKHIATVRHPVSLEHCVCQWEIWAEGAQRKCSFPTIISRQQDTRLPMFMCSDAIRRSKVRATTP